VVRGLEDELRKLFGSYVEKKNSNQALDYDDLLSTGTR